MATTAVRMVGPRDGKLGKLGGIGVRFMVDGAESGGGFALVEHPMEPRALAAPMHRHSREDEYSFVLEGVGPPGVAGGGPPGFEKFFDTMAELAGRGELNPARLVALASEYGTEVDIDSVPQLVAAHGLTFAMGPSHE